MSDVGAIFFNRNFHDTHQKMDWYSRAQWDRVKNKSDLSPEEMPIWHDAKDRLRALKGTYYDLDTKLDRYLMGVLREYEAA